LNDKDKAWLNKFNNEYVGASLTRDKKTGRISSHHLHKTNKLAKSVFDANNKRNNDLYGVTKINGLQQSLDEYTFEGKENLLGTKVNNPELYEDAMIKMIDDKDIQDVIDEQTPKPKK
jgi:hypothetical protein